MTKYIDADVLKETIENVDCFDISQIDNALTADAMEVKHGKWIDDFHVVYVTKLMQMIKETEDAEIH